MTTKKDSELDARRTAEKLSADMPVRFMTRSRRQQLERILGELGENESPLKAAQATDEQMRKKEDQKETWQERLSADSKSPSSCPDKF